MADNDNVVAINFKRGSNASSVGASRESNLLNEKKRKLFEEWLQKGTVSVLLDAQKTGVKVPLEFSKESNLVLNFCYSFRVPDFNFNDVGIWATLSFESGDHFCMVPWSSIFGLQSSTLAQSASWFKDFPQSEAEESPFCNEPETKDNIIAFDFGRHDNI